MFYNFNNKLCISANWLSENDIISKSYLQNLKSQKKIKRAKYGGGLGNHALYIYESLPERFRNTIEIDLGIDPYKESRYVDIAKFLEHDLEAEIFLGDYRLEDGRLLAEVNEKSMNESYANAVVLNAIHKALMVLQQGGCRLKKSELWIRVSKGVHSRFTEDHKQRFPYDLPENPRALRARYESYKLKIPNRRYPRVGIEGLIHGNYCNSHSLKITDQIGKWLIAIYSLPNKYSVYQVLEFYTKARLENGWTVLTESGIENFLMRPENERLWTFPREGKEVYMKKYGHTLSKDKDRLFPNAHWAIDGTKFDAVHYWDNTGKMAAKCKINVIIDVYSEMIIGYSFSMTENHIDHFIALKMAVSTACARPYNFTYDAQSGHRSKKMQELYSKVIAKGGEHYHHKVGRKSNPIEQVFNRIQSQVIRKRWFCDGQSIKSKQNRSKPNMDFIQENKDALPTMEELLKHWEQIVEEWNSMPRSRKTTTTRKEYFQKQTDYTQEISPLDSISMFWLNESRPKIYYPHGMPLTVAGMDYLYEVYDENGQIDMDFRLKYVRQKLIVSYDPEFLDQYIALYRLNDKNEKVFVAYAMKKREYVEVDILKKVGEHEQIMSDIAVRDAELTRDFNAYKKIANEMGITGKDLIKVQNESIDPEFQAKRAAYATKEENLESDNNELFNRITK